MSLRLRPVELGLLLAVCLWVVMGLASRALAQGSELSFSTFLPALIFTGLALAVHLFLSVTGFSGDQLLMPLTMGLVGVGVVFIGRLAGSAVGLRQLVWLSLSLGAMLITLFFLRSTAVLRRFRYTWGLLGFALVAVTFVFGTSPTGLGPRLWLDFRLFYFQPSEVLKILLAVFFASYLSEYRELITWAPYSVWGVRLPPLPYLIPLVVMGGMALALVVVQRDLGVALLLFGVFLAMLYGASGRLSYLGLGVVGFAVVAGVGYRLVTVVQERVDAWLDPWPRAAAGSYQVVQGLIALGSGGLLGVGLGQGQPNSVPAAHTDFIFAAIGEEMGLLGAVAVVLIYILLAYRGYRIALSAADPFHQLLALGLTTVLALQALVIMGGNVGVLPLTGVPLPFVSYGGSSLLANFVIVGLLLRISEGRR